MMHTRNGRLPHSSEPKVIALAATKTRPAESLIWQVGLALLAYSWLSLLLH